MFSKKVVFETYLEQLGLSEPTLEAVKDINGVLFESIDDLLGDMDADLDSDGTNKGQGNGEDIQVSSVAEQIPGEPEISAVEPKKEYTDSELDYKLKVPFHDALRLAFAWAHNESRFDLLWNDHNGIDSISYMIPSNNGEHVFFSADRILYEINAEGEGDVPKYTYPTETNVVKMSKNVHDRVTQYYGESDLSDIPFEDIKHLVLGNAVHQTGEEAPNIGVPCRVEVDPSAILLSTNVDNRDSKTGVVVPNQENRQKLSQEYGRPVESLYTALLKEWTDASDRYYMDGNTGVIYDVTKDVSPAVMSEKDMPVMSPRKKGPTESSLKLNMKVIDWAKTQDMFKLLLKPNAAGVPKLVYSNTIYKVPNNGNIEGITGNTPYVYMDDANYASYVNSNPSFDQSQVQKFGVDALNTIVSGEYKDRSLSDTSSANAFGYDENGWVGNLECELVDHGIYALKRGVDSLIRKAYGRDVAGVNNYIAGKNIITIGGKQDLDGNVTGGIDCHPLVLLDRTAKGSLVARLVAVFDESCCAPGESLSKIVGVDGLRGGTPTIQGFATILNGCNLGKTGDFVINECVLSNVDISKSSGFVKIGARGSRSKFAGGVTAPMKTVVTDTVIAVGNNGAAQALPNNRVNAEMSHGMRGVSIMNSVVSDSIIENGYAEIEDCNIKNLNMSNEGPKRLKGWSTDDASNVEFKGGNLISISGTAKYFKGKTQSEVAGARSTFEYEDGDVVTQFTGTVVLNSGAGTVVCSGSTMENVVANGPCNIRTCTLKGTTVGINAEAGGEFAMTDMNAVNTTPAGEGPNSIQIEHGRDKATVFGNAKKDKTHGMIELSGKVYVEGGAQVLRSIISSADDSQEAYVRSNMRLTGCAPYTLNQKDSGLLSKYLHGEDTLTGDCTDVRKVANALQREFNEFGGSTQRDTPFEKYEKFKSGDMSLKDLTLFDSASLVDDFLKQNTSAVLMDKSVFMDITDDGSVVPNGQLKTTIWDPVGGFFVGPINKGADGVTKYGPMVLLKCPNVVLNIDAIFKKKHEAVYNLDYEMYSSGKVTLRQYVDFLKNNGHEDCFYYVDAEGKPTDGEQDFVQLLLISKQDMRTPHKLSMEQMQILATNAKRIVAQFRSLDTSSSTTIRDVDTIDNITSAYTNREGGMVVETDRGRYEYSAPRVDDVGTKIECTCSRKWRDDEGKTQYSTTTIDCGVDAMYKAGYQYLVNSRTSANSTALDIIRRAISGNTEGLGQRDYLSSVVNTMAGNEMKSNEVDSVEGDVYNKILKLLSLDKGEKVYHLTDGDTMTFLAKGKLISPRPDEREHYINAGCQKLRYRPISYSADDGRFIVNAKSYVFPVKMRNNLKPSAVQMRHLLGREATLNDFIKMGVPDPRG